MNVQLLPSTVIIWEMVALFEHNPYVCTFQDLICFNIVLESSEEPKYSYALKNR